MTESSLNTFNRLKAKSVSSWGEARMPSISSISKLLTEHGIDNNVRDKTNVVEYRSGGGR